MFKKIIVFLSVILVVLGGASYFVSSYMSGYLIKNLPVYQKSLSKIGVQLLYDDISTQNCFLSLCLKAQNVRLKIMHSEIPLGNALLDFSLLNRQNGTILITPQEKDGLLLEAHMTNGIVVVDKSQFSFQEFNASFIGEYDLKQAQIRGLLDSVNLAYFAKHFVHPSFYGMIDLFLTDQPHKINIDTHNSFMRFNKFPVFKLKPLLF